jgi:hypothetical protein
MTRRNLFSVLTALLIGVYFVMLTKDVTRSYFSPDDCMTIYRSWANSAGSLVKANFLFFLNSPFYRPMGSVWYRLMFELAGFNPVPFHISNLFTLAANMWFTYCVSSRLSGSRTAGALAALLIAYHGRFINLYFDTGYIYDVVCYFFYFATFSYYLRVRSRPRPPLWREVAVLSVLYICALNAKEMAVTLPMFLAIYEWLYHRESMGGVRDCWKWPVREGRGFLVAGVISLAFVLGRFTTATGLRENEAFQTQFTIRRFMETSTNFISPLLFRDELLPSGMVLAIWVALFAIAWVSKIRALKFAWLFLMLSALPVAFIPPRGPGQYYIPFFGWLLYAAVGLFEGTKRLFVRWPVTVRAAWIGDAMLMIAVTGVMYVVNRPYGWADVDAVAVEGEEIRVIVDQVHRLRPTLRHGARVLLLDDPIDDEWRMMYLMKMSYRDDDLVIDRVRFMKPPPTPAEVEKYDYVFDYLHGRFYNSPQPRPSAPQPEIVYERGYPAVFRHDWTPVRPWNPARRGERVISMVENLGDTIPPVPLDKPFPSDPYAHVVSPFEIRVDGQPAKIVTEIGWPEKVNRYRVDFEIPQDVKPGELPVIIARGNRAGPATPLLLQ